MASKDQITTDTAALLALIAAAPAGLTVDDVLAAPKLALDRRTVQRRLKRMVLEGALRIVGKGPATRYVTAAAAPVPSTSHVTPHLPPKAPDDPEKPVLVLSPEGQTLLEQIQRPIERRKPVGYNTAFLEAYVPNQTRYLDEAHLEPLRQVNRDMAPGDAPAGTYAQQILNRLLIDLSWNSSRLEGNTYSLLDTQRLLEGGEGADEKSVAETNMILNHKRAIELLVQAADEIGFNRYTILNLHAILADNLLPNPRAAGRLREIPVAITQTVFYPLEGLQRIASVFELFLAKAAAIEDAYEEAFFAMVHLPYLQPFEDVNKRVSRLSANIPFVRRNLSPLAFIDVPAELYTRATLAVYELNRVELLRDVFVWAYVRSGQRFAAVRQSIGAPDTFRLRHRQAIKDVVSTVMGTPMTQAQATAYIARWAKTNIEAAAQARFIEVCETELLDVHEGNFARFQVRPSEFEAWWRMWTRT